MAEAPKREYVGIFNPLILPLPNWHPDGPDGEIDGFAIPFVMPPPDEELAPNRHARVDVYPDDMGRWAAILSNVYMAGAEVRTADQARALAGAWIRAAEVLDNVAKRAAAGRRPDPDDVVDCEVVEDDDEDQDDDPKWNRRLCCPSDLSAPHVPGCTFEPREDQPIDLRQS